ncbi:DUF559 domain-containing protein [Arcanobacterium haemolyticum]|nr:DUF559 domain-containing protein [Arcanobacterium haemolyticum]
MSYPQSGITPRRMKHQVDIIRRMSKFPHNVLLTCGTEKRSLTAPYFHLTRGAVLLDSLPQASPWQVRDYVNLARIQAMFELSRRPITFTQESALLLHNTIPWNSNPDVCFRSSAHAHRRVFNDVVVDSVRIPAVQVRSTTFTIDGSKEVRIQGISVDSLADTAVIMALTRPTVDAFVAVCSVMRELTGGDSFSRRSIAQREFAVRSELLNILENVRERRKRLIRYRRARQIIEGATALCENRGEAAMLWILRTIFGDEVQPQFEIVVYGNRYFADFAIERIKMLVEFDGIEKLSGTPEEAWEAQSRFLDRQQDLINNGWLVLRFRWRDLFSPETVRFKILQAAAQRASDIWRENNAEIYRKIDAA